MSFVINIFLFLLYVPSALLLFNKQKQNKVTQTHIVHNLVYKKSALLCILSLIRYNMYMDKFILILRVVYELEEI